MTVKSGAERRSRSSSRFSSTVTEGANQDSLIGPRGKTPAGQRGFEALHPGNGASKTATLLECNISSAADLTKARENLKKILSLQKILLHAPSTDARLLECRGQMHEVDQALLNQQKYYAREEEQFRLKESQLREKEAQLHVQLERFNRFIDTNAEKKHRAEQRAAAEHEAIHQEERKIATLKLELGQKETQCAKLEAYARKYKTFEEFLTAAVREGEDFQEISDLMTRYELLMSIHSNLVKKEEELNEKSDRMRNALLAYKKHAANEILEKNNVIAALRRELEACEKEKVGKQGQADEFLSHATDEALYFGQLLLSIQNIFQRCAEKRPNIQHASCLARLLPPPPVLTQGEQLWGTGNAGSNTGNSALTGNTPRDDDSSGARGGKKPPSDSEEAKQSSTTGLSDNSGNEATGCSEKGSCSRKQEGTPTMTPRGGAATAIPTRNAHPESADPSKPGAASQENVSVLSSCTSTGIRTNLAPADFDLASISPDSNSAFLKGGSGASPPGQRGGATTIDEKAKSSEPRVDRRKACDDAVHMLGVVEKYLKDFKDICETLTKNKRQQPRGARFVNINVNYARENEVVEFVKVYDTRGQKNCVISGGDTTKDALASASSKIFFSRTRTQALRHATGQTLPLTTIKGTVLKNNV